MTVKMEPKRWVMLENNPDVMNQLAAKLGLSPKLRFYDVYSLDEDQLAHIPRPALALLVIIPLTPAWDQNRQAEDADPETYKAGRHTSSDLESSSSGSASASASTSAPAPDDPVIWFKQTIGHACGSIGLLHSVVNGPAAAYIEPGSDLADLRRRAAQPLLGVDARAALLYDSEAFEAAHKSVERAGDSEADMTGKREGGHFVSFVKQGGRLWELEGSRLGPIDRGALGGEDEDVLSPRALEMGIKRIIELNAGMEGGMCSLAALPWLVDRMSRVDLETVRQSFLAYELLVKPASNTPQKICRVY